VQLHEMDPPTADTTLLVPWGGQVAAIPKMSYTVAKLPRYLVNKHNPLKTSWEYGAS